MTEEFNVTMGLLMLKGPFSNQSFQCELGSLCVVSGLKGAKLSKGDQLVAMKDCGTSLQASSFADPKIIHGNYDDVHEGNLILDFGTLPVEGSPEIVQLCWCSFESSCTNYEDFRVQAMQLQVVCPPGTYELELVTEMQLVQCQECPPGYFCPGGLGAELKSCDYGSTSAARSTALNDCECRPGFWNGGTLCTACSIGSFKDSIGALPCQSCPLQTTTMMSGANAISECICANNMVDTDPRFDIFNCTSPSSLSHLSGLSVNFATTQVLMHVFNGSIMADSTPVQDLQTALIAYLSNAHPMFGQGASLALDSESGLISLIDFEVMSSEEELSLELQAMFDPQPFTAWAQSVDLFGVKVIENSAVSQQFLQCPDGLEFPPGSRVHGLVDCKCPYGMQPKSGSGLESGCVACPKGQYKATVEDSSCQSCGLGLTTQQLGAISIHACTCSAGSYMTVSNDPTSCQSCGLGFFCQGAAHREACPQSKTTLVDVAVSVDDCVCAQGYSVSPSASGCQPCSAGSFKVEAGNGDCELCPLGTWSNTAGAALSASCIPCIAGSTTAFQGAWSEDSCIRPRSGQDFLCTSGQVCTLQIEGFQLRDGHRLSITSSETCGVAQVVPNIAQQGMSQTNDGSIYSWGHLSLMDFVPQGGENYGLCWCANLRDLTCNTLQSYQISAGQLQVVGPFSNHLFHCVRGQDCTGLQPVEGVGLGDNQVALRSNGCGSASFLQISLSNGKGIANLQSLPANDSFVTFSLSFGISIPEEGLDHTLLLDASESGYDLCWCSQTLGSHDV